MMFKLVVFESAISACSLVAQSVVRLHVPAVKVVLVVWSADLMVVVVVWLCCLCGLLT